MVLVDPAKRFYRLMGLGRYVLDTPARLGRVEERRLKRSGPGASAIFPVRALVAASNPHLKLMGSAAPLANAAIWRRLGAVLSKFEKCDHNARIVSY
jgi:hypothetical protein